jgi:hypothetical protein
MGAPAFLLMQFAAWSLGALLLRALGVRDTVRWGGVPWAFAMGHGALALLTLGLGLTGALRPVAFLALDGGLCLAGASLLLRGRGAFRLPRFRLDPTSWIFLAVLAGFGAVCLAQALTPPTAKDVVAYQFGVARWYAMNGSIEFVPNNWSYHFPALTNLSYLHALVLGGEMCAKLHDFAVWAVACAAVAALAGGAAATRIAAACVFASVPIVAAHGGLGYVDLSTGLFGVLALAAILRCVDREGETSRWSLVAGCLAGFAAGSKLTGLLVPIALAPLLLTSRKLHRGLPALLLGVLAAGFPFYLLNWVQAGNPLWPYFHGVFGGRELTPEFSRMLLGMRNVGEGTVGRTLLRIVRLPWDLSMSWRWAGATDSLGPAFLGYLPLCPFLLLAADRRRAGHVALFSLAFLLPWFFLSPMIRLAHPVWAALSGLVAASALARRSRRGLVVLGLPLLLWCLFSLGLMGRWLWLNGSVHYLTGRTARADFLASRLRETFAGGPDYRDLAAADRHLEAGERLLTNVHYRYYVDGRHEDLRQLANRGGPGEDAAPARWEEFADRVLAYARERGIRRVLLDRSAAPDRRTGLLLEALRGRDALAPVFTSETIELCEITGQGPQHGGWR